jgi:prolyl-tRNA synthetase family I
MSKGLIIEHIMKKYEIVSKSVDHGKWYQSVLLTSETIDYSDTKGCYVIRSWGLDMWEIIKQFLDPRIQNLHTSQGHGQRIENCYFPLFCTKSNLEKEAKHFDDFVPEVAWVQTNDHETESLNQKYDPDIQKCVEKLRGKGLDVHIKSTKSEKYAIRPTSETIIYPHFASWIKSTGRYPKINQWANVVRWENKATLPFIRSREFLWQEGHTCHKDEKTALYEIDLVIDLYKDFYKNVLAVPMIQGIKTKSETFPGAEMTATIEGVFPDQGKGIQSATSHYLGEKFSKIFNIKNSDGQFVHQNSWGLTTRSIGIMVMTHSDDRGLSLPPNVSPIQVVIVGCGLNTKTTQEDKKLVHDELMKLQDVLNANGIRTFYDSDPSESPGMKFNKWEIRGVPLRIEIGPRDIKSGSMFFVRRDQAMGIKHRINTQEVNPEYVRQTLNQIQTEMFNKALDRIKNSIQWINCVPNNNDITDDDIPENFDTVIQGLRDKKLVMIPWKIEKINQLEIKLKNHCLVNEISSVKVLCLPTSDVLKELDCPYGPLDDDTAWVLYGKSY